jgi:hypothetical protein
MNANRLFYWWYLARRIRRCRHFSPQTPAVARSQRRDMRRVLAMVVAEMPGTASTAFSKSMSAEPLSANAILDPHNDAADVTPSEPPWPTQCPP